MQKHKTSFTPVQRKTAEAVILRFCKGADTFADITKLPPLQLQNSSAMHKPKVGKVFTDNLVSALLNKFVCGPFDNPPIPGVRLNQLFVVEQEEKLRPILNLSAPPSSSFNDAIDDESLPKVTMATARSMADVIIDKGKECYIAKCDMVSAYKLIPTCISQLHLQGFQWLSKVFLETQQVFGSKSAVYIYDQFHTTVLDLTEIMAKPEPDSIHKCLDDALFCCSSLEEIVNLYGTYRKVAHDLDIPLATEDNPDKAFQGCKKGTMLGIIFDTQKMTWSLSAKKVAKFSYPIQQAIFSHKVSKRKLQSILGFINNVTLMIPELRFFKTPVVKDLKRSYREKSVVLRPDTITCLYNWLRILKSTQEGLPLGRARNLGHPVPILCYTTDAAGIKKNASMKFNIGAAGVRTSFPAETMTWYVRSLWPKDFITLSHDEKGSYIGAKSTTLEMLGILLPLYHDISVIINNTVLLEVDNKAVVFSFKNGRSKMDSWASLILESIMFVAHALPFKLFFQHRPRCSNGPATTADTLSRSDKKGLLLLQDLQIPADSGWPPSILCWMKKPQMDSSLPRALLADFQAKLGR